MNLELDFSVEHFASRVFGWMVEWLVDCIGWLVGWLIGYGLQGWLVMLRWVRTHSNGPSVPQFTLAVGSKINSTFIRAQRSSPDPADASAAVLLAPPLALSLWHCIPC